jgi:hypothetical protein
MATAKNNHHTKAADFDTRLTDLKSSLAGLVDFGSERADALKTKITDAGSTVSTGASSVLSSVRGYIKAHPLAMVGAAFGVGYIAMRLVRR